MPSLALSRKHWGWIESIVSAPTTSFHESEAALAIASACRDAGLDLARDRYGNLIATTAPLSKQSEHLLGPVFDKAHLKHVLARSEFIVSGHMDHPGFEVVKVSGRDAQVKFLGAVHRGQFNGARVKAWDPQSQCWVKGKVKRRAGCGPATAAVYRASTALPIESMRVRFAKTIDVKSFGCFDHPGFLRRGKFVVTKSADNLMNCAVSVIALESLKARHPGRRFTAVFTRGEEEGFVGLFAMVRDAVIPRRVPWIVLEASKAMGDVKLGSGAVVRVGDAASTFHSVCELWLKRTVQICAMENKEFTSQRALMSGGTCEATLLNCEGVFVGGLALPLKNYHNVGRSRAEPEMVHETDILSMLSILTTLPRTPHPGEVTAELRRRLSTRGRASLHRLGKSV
jgi:putative aminopeptidase FrvX